ncbi:MAG: hypothetical protein COY66_06565 [Candidatus Kerfeldbacteria bacterium CG_4_10_14_0_8_um_filter_42_10]|uniref:NADPH-dependent FMN reductase-like domain-containing protein n=1 Tax=Candidatus Kerfeldbacteria bacterium CG_4_10_14_0_8_um_filter_42_10 TaxID=2014248 RepID=A0A2M7RFI0_9BACT|nr:MAG: hypothetical protein COY66_06565 [Candidatus Kerfeldbacteria bacterium CG_4_10_14_0_8_um_filter_42_10]
MKKTRVLAISGSLRKASYNRLSLKIAQSIALNWGAEVAEIDLKELSLPIYDQDIEDEKFPESAVELKSAIEQADVLLIASPEYNASVSGALKNALDWISRNKNSLKGKVAAVFGASDGKFGTVRGQLHLREILAKLSVFVLPTPQVFIREADRAFNSDGSFKDPETFEKLKELIESTLEYSKKMFNT